MFVTLLTFFFADFSSRTNLGGRKMPRMLLHNIRVHLGGAEGKGRKAVVLPNIIRAQKVSKV